MYKQRLVRYELKNEQVLSFWVDLWNDLNKWKIVTLDEILPYFILDFQLCSSWYGKHGGVDEVRNGRTKSNFYNSK